MGYYGIITHPPGETTPAPPGHVSPIPGGSVTPVAAGRVTAGPAGSVTAGPAGHVVVGPAGSITTAPGGHITTAPAGHSVTHPAGHTVTAPAGHTVTAPAGHTVTAPAGHTVTAPAGHTVTAPAGHTVTGPSGSLTIAEPGRSTPAASIQGVPGSDSTRGERGAIIDSGGQVVTASAPAVADGYFPGHAVTGESASPVAVAGAETSIAGAAVVSAGGTEIRDAATGGGETAMGRGGDTVTGAHTVQPAAVVVQGSTGPTGRDVFSGAADKRVAHRGKGGGTSQAAPHGPQKRAPFNHVQIGGHIVDVTTYEPISFTDKMEQAGIPTGNLAAGSRKGLTIPDFRRSAQNIQKGGTTVSGVGSTQYTTYPMPNADAWLPEVIPPFSVLSGPGLLSDPQVHFGITLPDRNSMRVLDPAGSLVSQKA